ncbi:DUF6191 domain-containing protein [Streptomyces sp. NPDC049813]|uniref:DUF6191 domain-containing protein n=1 Tax=Streptomyces sp. NPDC049813 TaxID=3365597 RepID=UPI0037A26F82
MFEELFAPGRKHTNDERKRLELTRVDLNDGDPGRGPIDLSSGKVTVRAPDRPQDDQAPPPGPTAPRTGPTAPPPGPAAPRTGPAAPRPGPASEPGPAVPTD